MKKFESVRGWRHLYIVFGLFVIVFAPSCRWR
jgi:hypothetical protein